MSAPWALDTTLKKRTRSLFLFSPHSLLFCFHSPVLIISSLLLFSWTKAVSFPFLSPAPSFIPLICLNLPPADCQPTYLHFPCQGWLVRAEGKRSEEKRLAKIKELSPLPWAELLLNAIYLPFASPCASVTEHRTRERQRHATHRLDTMTSRTIHL